MVEIEHFEQIPYGRAVDGHVGVLMRGDRVGKVVAAASGQRLQPPVLLDELGDGNVIIVGVDDLAALRIRRHNN